MFGNVRGGNYGRVGQALARQQKDLHDVNMAASPDYGKIARESIKGRSRERQAVTQSEAKVHRVGLDAAAFKEKEGILSDAEARVEEIKKPARRMAGIVGAAGELAGAWILKQGIDADKELQEKRDAATAEFRRRTIEALNNSTPPPATPLPKPPTREKPQLEEIPTIDFTPGTPGSDNAAARRLWCRRPVHSVLGGEKGRVGRGAHCVLGAPERTPVSGVLNTRRTVPRAQGPYQRRQRRRQLARLRAPLPPRGASEVPEPRGPRPRDEFRRAPRRARAPPAPTLPRRPRVRALVCKLPQVITRRRPPPPFVEARARSERCSLLELYEPARRARPSVATPPSPPRIRTPRCQKRRSRTARGIMSGRCRTNSVSIGPMPPVGCAQSRN